MSDVFISYSRKDIAFARLLHEALQKGDVETWIDWARIPVGEKWWDEICEAISQASVFLFIISRQSIGSEVCKKEIDQALSHNKRIIPVIVDDTSVAAIQEFVPDLTMINWIIFKQDDVFKIEERPNNKLKPEEQFAALPREPRFQHALEKLNTAIHTDWGWVKAHTRLESRALEWERKEEETSLLLRGKDLREAEEQLNNATARKDPQPTDLQKKFVQTSHAAEKRRTQFTVGGIALAVIAAAILGYFVWNRSKAATEASGIAESEAIARSTAEYQAQQQQATAQAENIRAEALRLASEAEKIINDNQGDKALALLLSIQSLNRQDNDLAEKVMFLEMLNLNYSPNFSGHGSINQDDEVYQAIFSPDGRFVLSGGNDSSIKIWDSSTGALVHTFWDHTDTINSIDFSPDGKSFLSASMDGTVTVRNFDTHEKYLTILSQSGSIYDAEYSPDGKLIATANKDCNVSLWEVSSGLLAREYSFSGWSCSAYDLAFSPDGKSILVSDHTSLYLLDVATEEAKKDINTSNVYRLAFSPDGNFYVTSSLDGLVSLWNSQTGDLIRTFRGLTKVVYSLAFSPDGKSLAAVSEDKHLKIWNVNSGIEINDIPFEKQYVYSLSFSSDGKYIAAGASDGSTILILSETGEIIQKLDIFLDTSSIVFSPDGKYVAAADSNYTVRMWDPYSAEQIRSFAGHSDSITCFSFSPDGKFIATASKDKSIIIFDTQSDEPILVINEQPEFIEDIAFSVDNSLIAIISSPYMIKILDTKTGNELSSFSIMNARQVRFSVDGNTLYSKIGRDIDSIDLLAEHITTNEFENNPIYFGSDFLTAPFYAIPSADRDAIKILDAKTNTLLRSFNQALSTTGIVHISTDGKNIITINSDGDALILDGNTGEIIRTFYGEDYSIRNVLFSPDGRSFLIGSDYGNVTLWDTDYHDAITRACSQLTRDLTPEERTQYGITDDTPTCVTLYTGAEN